MPSGGNEKETDGEVGDESAAAVQAVLNGAVAAVVYRSAVKAVPQSVGFRRKFLDILQPFDFPGKKSLEVGSNRLPACIRTLIRNCCV